MVVTLKKGDKEWKLNVGNDAGSGTASVYVSTGAKPKQAGGGSQGGLERRAG